MQRVILAGAALAVALSTPVFAETQILIGRGAERIEKASFTQEFVQELVASGADVRETSAREAVALAAASGVDVSKTASLDWEHPWVIVKAGLGFPGAVTAVAEVYVMRTLTVEAGIGAGPLGTVYQGAVRWRPEATCWGCEGMNLFSIGFGIEAGAIPNAEGAGGGTALFTGASVDAQYIHRFARHFGWVIGLNLGLGTGTTVQADLTPGGERWLDHKWITTGESFVMPVGLLYTGVTF